MHLPQLKSEPPIIGLLLTSKIGNILGDGIAGTEKVFFDDSFFLRQHFTVKAFARFTYKNTLTIKLFSPAFLLTISHFLESDRQFLHMVAYALNVLHDFLYSVNFLIQSGRCSKYLAYSFPMIALFSPKKTIIIMESFQKFPFSTRFASKYRQARFLFISKFLLNKTLEEYPILKNNNWHVLYNSVDTQIFTHHSHNSIKEKFPSKIKFLFASAWVPQKGLDILLEAWSMLTPKLSNLARLTIASNEKLWFQEFPSDNEWYVCKIKKLLTQCKSVKLLGGVPPSHMPKIYQEHNFLIFTSIWGEPFSLIILEALASGLWVVGFNDGSVKEAVSRSNSHLMNKKDSKTLYKTIAKLIITYAVNRSKLEKTKLTKKNQKMLCQNRYRSLLSYLNS
jgi:glycosyltransferase involved in cell wall biosynthesis